MNLRYFLFISIYLLLTSCDQTFIPIDPQVEELKIEVEKSDFFYSMGYVYLLKNYLADSQQDSLSFIAEDAENPCGFYHEFKNGIQYTMNQCSEEGGFTEHYSFPKTDRKVMKAFIQKLFYQEENVWTDENTYAPDGAGCYYQIMEKANRTEIEVYCGC